jgi:hypothetical protein
VVRSAQPSACAAMAGTAPWTIDSMKLVIPGRRIAASLESREPYRRLLDSGLSALQASTSTRKDAAYDSNFGIAELIS